jgi:hypothetical protein
MFSEQGLVLYPDITYYKQTDKHTQYKHSNVVADELDRQAF